MHKLGPKSGIEPTLSEWTELNAIISLLNLTVLHVSCSESRPYIQLQIPLWCQVDKLYFGPFEHLQFRNR